jgi:hypothetical protein
MDAGDYVVVTGIKESIVDADEKKSLRLWA